MSEQGCDADTDEGKKDLSCPTVTAKYHIAADIANLAIKKVLEQCKEGALLYDLCVLGDETVSTETSKQYNKKDKGKKVEKGTAFPTCVSINEVCSNFSPLQGDSTKLVNGDVVKINLGCHIDGYIAVVGHTLIIGAGDDVPTTGRKADVMLAAWNAAEAALRAIKIGSTNTFVTKMIEKAAAEYKCQPIQGVVSHEMKRHVIEGNHFIANRQSTEDRVEEFTIGANEVYGVHILMSTGEGKVRETDVKTTVFRREVQNSYCLKTTLGRQFMADVNKKFPTLPFCMRAIEDERACLVGVTEALRHDLLCAYPVLTERGGEFVAEFKFSVLLLPGGTKKITGLPFDQMKWMKSDLEITDEELKNLLATSASSKKKKKKKKGDGVESGAGETDDSQPPS